MKRLSEDIVHFFKRQNFIIVSTIGRDGMPHNACKGIVKIGQDGRIYLLDLYKMKTYSNLVQNSNISITAVNEHTFRGYCLKGKARIIKRDILSTDIIKAWENKINNRIIQRLLKNIRGERGHSRHPEALLPRPAYMIALEVREIVDLTPRNIR